jgi:hypothetical protein
MEHSDQLLAHQGILEKTYTWWIEGKNLLPKTRIPPLTEFYGVKESVFYGDTHDIR